MVSRVDIYCCHLLHVNEPLQIKEPGSTLEITALADPPRVGPEEIKSVFLAGII